MSFPFYNQYDAMDCGPTCLRMIAKHYGREMSIGRLRESAGIGRDGVSLLGIREAAERIGLKTTASRLTFEQLDEGATLPCILYWRQNHFVVLPPQNYSRHRKRARVLIADPAHGLLRMDRDAFLQAWEGEGGTGFVLMVEPTPAFYAQDEDGPARVSWASLLIYLKQHKGYFGQVLLGLFAGAVLQLIFPFLTQSLVDTGIQTHNLPFIYIILAAQGMLFFARTAIEVIRSRLLLFISTRVNISLLTGFWYKLMRLPLAFFDTKLTGDIQQRLQDQRRIETFLTGSSLSVLFSAINLLVFSLVLLVYSKAVFFIFGGGALLYFAWVRLFFRRRRELNHQRFTLAGKEATATLELIQGMQEIRMANASMAFRWNWEQMQARLFRLNFKSLSLSQAQQAGAFFINEGKNILITFFTAKLVIEGQITLGAMLAIQYIIGQMNSPLEGMIGFTQSFQDAKIALERLNEIHTLEEEEPEGKEFLQELPAGRSLALRDLHFTYPGAGSAPVLNGISLTVPERKVTAIVGASGSGKTTLLRLLLRFYDHYTGTIRVGGQDPSFPGHSSLLLAGEHALTSGLALTGAGTDLRQISPSGWRGRCGIVLQDGYIFNDSIAGNIAVGESTPHPEKLRYAARMANVLSFIESLPLGFGTKIGAEGAGISQGQKQRILIARAVYKDPDYIFLDEATNALDAVNEKVIHENLQQFFQGRTVIVVAHRLSTVKEADKIVVMHEGRIVEEGTHDSLSRRKGYYYDLVKNQLELGN